jgi:hypothetical protein
LDREDHDEDGAEIKGMPPEPKPWQFLDDHFQHVALHLQLVLEHI